jgi:hypothetical protein
VNTKPPLISWLEQVDTLAREIQIQFAEKRRSSKGQHGEKGLEQIDADTVTHSPR